MLFNKVVTQPNPQFDEQVAAKQEALNLIAHIDQFLAFVDDVSEYETVKTRVNAFTPSETINVRLSEDVQADLSREFNRLLEIAEQLK